MNALIYCPNKGFIYRERRDGYDFKYDNFSTINKDINFIFH
jgi:hypothetical protein